MLQIEKLKKENEYTFNLIGRLDTLTAPEFEQELYCIFDDADRLIVDMKNLEYISSAGLRTLLIAVKNMHGLNAVTIINVQDEVMDIFEITGFADILNIQ